MRSVILLRENPHMEKVQEGLPSADFSFLQHRNVIIYGFHVYHETVLQYISLCTILGICAVARFRIASCHMTLVCKLMTRLTKFRKLYAKFPHVQIVYKSVKYQGRFKMAHARVSCCPKHVKIEFDTKTCHFGRNLQKIYTSSVICIGTNCLEVPLIVKIIENSQFQCQICSPAFLNIVGSRQRDHDG